MSTIGYLFILVAILIVRGVTKGRTVKDLPGDLGDLFVAAVSANPAGVKEVLARESSTDTAAMVVTTAVASSDVVAVGTGGKHTQADLIALGKALQAQGCHVGEGPPPFGPIHRVHAPNSYHYRKGPTGVEGEALDVNYDGHGSGAEKAKFDVLAPQLVAQGWRVAWWTTGHFDHMHVDIGPAGRLKL